MRNVFLAVMIILPGLFCSPGYAMESTPIQLSLFPPLQLFSEEKEVRGLRINVLHGVSRKVSGLDIGFVNEVKESFYGVQCGSIIYLGFNITNNFNGLQLADLLGGLNSITGKSRGVQISGIGLGVNKAEELTGIQISGLLAGFNKAGTVTGIQIAGLLYGVNIATDMKGGQIGILYNQADAMRGLQVGLVNYTNSMRGIQIGFVNIIRQGRISFSPICNAQF